MRDLHEEEELFKQSFKLSQDGSVFYHCTPKILGPSSLRILSLDYSKMRVLGADIVYHFNTVEGMNIPNLVLNVQTREQNKDIRFSVECNLADQPLDLCRRVGIIPLPDLNALTPFTEQDCSIVFQYQYNSMGMNIGITDQYEYDSSIILSNEKHSFTIHCFRFSIKFND